MKEDYDSIVSHYERCFEMHGDSPRGLDWSNLEDMRTRYRVMVELIDKRDAGASLLDFGCGAAGLLDYINENHRRLDLRYSGLDMGESFIEYCRKKHPGALFYHVDVLKKPGNAPRFDYIVMNGVFTEKVHMAFDDMLRYFKRLVSAVFKRTDKGMAFNVMSKHVDWERDDLFHLPFDLLADYLVTSVSRNFVIRNDYGLYEYTTYIYK